MDMHLNGSSWSHVSQDFERTLNWRSIVDEKHTHIEDADDLWNEIKAEVGEDYAIFVIPILNRASDPTAMDSKLQQALKK